MKKTSALTALILVLFIATVAVAQSEQKINIKVRVAPYLQVSQEPMVFSPSKDDPGVFDTGWTTVAYGNAPWQALLSLNPVFAASNTGVGGRMLDTEYEIQTRVNGEVTIKNITVNAGAPGYGSLPCAHGTPHNGVIEMRVIAKVRDAGQTQNLTAPQPPGMTFMVSPS